MSEVAISFEDISKCYKLGTIGTGTFSHDLKRWWIVKVRGREDPYLTIGSENTSNYKDDSSYVWALKGIDFKVNQGEVLGIIGKNGAGKSTLLKILSRVTSPTTGSIKAKGRIASLLEVGTGFHPEMTGRENIFMNGSIMGMSKVEIKRKFDEIVDFAGVERYIDTPVKRYSSGMTVRLGFAIAAHLEPEILVVDEVLAVGDAEFQKKAIGKMKDVSHDKGRTVLFVSHNMQAIRQLCERSILLDSGKIVFDDMSSETISYYLQDRYNTKEAKNLKDVIQNLPSDPVFKLVDVRLTQKGVKIIDIVENGKSLEIEIQYQVFGKTTGLRIYFDLCDEQDLLLFRSFHDESSDGIPIIEPGNYVSKAILPQDLLGPATYLLKIQAGIYNIRNCLPESGISIPLKVEKTGNYNRAYLNDTFRGKLALLIDWENKRSN